jgi:hypothetical protein
VRDRDLGLDGDRFRRGVVADLVLLLVALDENELVLHRDGE